VLGGSSLIGTQAATEPGKDIHFETTDHLLERVGAQFAKNFSNHSRGDASNESTSDAFSTFRFTPGSMPFANWRRHSSRRIVRLLERYLGIDAERKQLLFAPARYLRRH
jgi:hypothetical protein